MRFETEIFQRNFVHVLPPIADAILRDYNVISKTMQLEFFMECLLVKLSDGRRFFTKKKHQSVISAFAKTCKAKTEIVEAIDPTVKSLQELVDAICDPNVKSDYKGHVALNKETDMRRKLLFEMKGEMVTKLLSGGTVSVKELSKNYNSIPLGAIYKLLKEIKGSQSLKGQSPLKVSPGTYKIFKADLDVPTPS
jgi:hypothetical protein